MVATSRVTKTRPASAAIRSTSESGVPSAMTPFAPRKSILGSRLRKPVRSQDSSPHRLGKIFSSRLRGFLVLDPLIPLHHVGRKGILSLDFLIAALLLLQVGCARIGVLEDEGDYAVDLS